MRWRPRWPEPGRPPLAGADLVDVGANIGTTTVNALGGLAMRRAACFEPLPANLALLRQNLLLNGLLDRAEVVASALSDREGSTRLPGGAAKNPSDSRVRVGGSAGAARLGKNRGRPWRCP